MTQDLKQTIEQYVGKSSPYIPSSGDAATDYDRRNEWYANARSRITRNPDESIPYLLDHLDEEATGRLLRPMMPGSLFTALQAIAAREDADRKARALGKVLDGQVDKLFESLTTYITSDYSDPVRRAAILMMAQVKHPMRDETLRQLAESRHDATQQAAKAALGQEANAPAEQKQINDSVTYTVREDVLDMLDALQDADVQQRLAGMGFDVIPGLMYAISEQQYKAYNDARNIMRQMPVLGRTESLLPYVERDHPPLVRAAAINLIAEDTTYPHRLDVLRAALEPDAHPQIHQAVLENIGAVGTAEDVERILPFLENENGATRNRAGTALADLGDPRGYPTVYGWVESKFQSVRLRAVSYLTNIDTPDAQQYLERLAADEDEEVREAAAQALKQR